MEAEEAWKAALGYVERDVDRSWFDRYVRETHVVSYNNDLFGIGEFDDFTFDWRWDLLTSTVSRVLTEIPNRFERVQFILVRSKGGEEKQSKEYSGQSDLLRPAEPMVDITQPVSSRWQGIKPLPDELTDRHGVWVAKVAGKILPIGKASEQTCRATPSRLAQELRYSHRTIPRVIRVLVEAGFMEDLTPTIPHRLHVYASTDQLESSEHIGIQRESFYEEKVQNQQVGKEGQCNE